MGSRVKLERISTEDEHRPGRPVESVTHENIYKIYDLVMLDRRIKFSDRIHISGSDHERTLGPQKAFCLSRSMIPFLTDVSGNYFLVQEFEIIRIFIVEAGYIDFVHVVLLLTNLSVSKQTVVYRKVSLQTSCLRLSRSEARAGTGHVHKSQKAFCPLQNKKAQFIFTYRRNILQHCPLGSLTFDPQSKGCKEKVIFGQSCPIQRNLLIDLLSWIRLGPITLHKSPSNNPCNGDTPVPLSPRKPRQFHQQERLWCLFLGFRGVKLSLAIIIKILRSKYEKLLKKREEESCPGILFTIKTMHRVIDAPYSPDIVPSNFHLFPHLKKSLSGIHFRSDE
ncbi:hypothetical protein LAZ67_4002790 [Cordylochernes scorpioides]|uniref:Maturase K n=1 Tax=Cordylochernes scorpioides TaxID=51811 RepID=A0ABY6KD36_9ARAC|nr:hypothetical protein LAZ67_4002790 [Cordylochernes scorpioides]